MVTIDESQFGFVQGRGKTDAIFVICQLQQKYFTVGKQIYMYMTIVDLEKAFDRVPQKVIWWAILRMDCGPYSGNVRCCVRVGECLSDKY